MKTKARVELRLADRMLEPKVAEFASTFPSEGALALRLDRPLGIRAAFDVEGYRTDVITAMSGDDVVGFATRAERLCYVNGKPEPRSVGLLGNLRIRPEFRSTMTLARGIRLFNSLDEMGDARFSLAFVQNENQAALELFESRRLLLPDFIPMGRLHSYFLGPIKYRAGASSFAVRRATNNDLELISTFHRSCGRQRQFFPFYSVDDLAGRTNRLRGLRVEDIFMCFTGERLVGTVARWSQRSFRNWVVQRYSPAMTALRPLYNFLAPLFGKLSMPAPGSSFAYDFLALVCIEENDPAVLRTLLGAAQGESKIPLVTTVHELDPLASVFRSTSRHRLDSRLYIVHRSGRRPRLDRPGERIPYIEGGTI